MKQRTDTKTERTGKYAKKHNRRSRRRAQKGKLCFLTCMAGIFLISAYMVPTFTYANRFIDGTYINGIDVGGRTAEEAEGLLKKKIEDYSLTLIMRAGVSGNAGDRSIQRTPEEKSRSSKEAAIKDVVAEKIPGESFGYTYVPSGEVAELRKSQNPLLWLAGRLGYRKDYTVNSATEYNAGKLSEQIFSLSESASERQISPTNAGLYLRDDNTFEIVPETYGSTLNMEGLISYANDAVKSSTEEINIAGNTDLYEQPSVVATDQNLVYQKDALNSFLNTQITYQMPDNQVRTLDRTTTSRWVTRQDNGYYYIDEDAISAYAQDYAAQLAEEFDVVRETRDFMSTNAGTVQVPCDTYGRMINDEEEAAAIKADLLGCTSEIREPSYYMNNLERDPRLGGTYVEIDKPAQTIYCYEDYELKMSSECVTGTETDPSRCTPTGIYSIYSMDRGATLRGTPQPDGSYAYESFVNYWMPFNGGIGFHDALWRDAFGGNIYQYNGSHGCINLPLGSAEQLFSLVSVGTPVVVIDY